MKKIIALLLALLLLACLTACSANGDYALTVSDFNVPSGLYAYYLNEVMSDPKAYSVESGDSEKISEKAAELCRECVAADKLMKESKITLDLYLKSDAAQDTESIWSLFGAYYKSVGVQKTDITLVNTFNAQKKQLVQYYYGAGGKKPVSEDDLKERFVEIYIGFKGFEVAVTKTNAKGETVDMTEKEKAAVEAELRSLAKKVDSGDLSIDEANKKYLSSKGVVVTDSLQLTLTKKNDPMYESSFFKKLSTLDYGRAAIIKSGKSIYVVQREKIAGADSEVFSQHRTEILEEIKLADVEKMISNKAQKLEITVNEKNAKKVFNTVSAVRRAKSTTTAVS